MASSKASLPWNSDHSASQAAATESTAPQCASPMPSSLRPSGWKREATNRPAAIRPRRCTEGSSGNSSLFHALAPHSSELHPLNV